MIDAPQPVLEAFKNNPETKLILEIAARARDLRSKEPPIEITASTDVVAIPSQQQLAV